MRKLKIVFAAFRRLAMAYIRSCCEKKLKKKCLDKENFSVLAASIAVNRKSVFRRLPLPTHISADRRKKNKITFLR